MREGLDDYSFWAFCYFFLLKKISAKKNKTNITLSRIDKMSRHPFAFDVNMITGLLCLLKYFFF